MNIYYYIIYTFYKSIKFAKPKNKNDEIFGSVLILTMLFHILLSKLFLMEVLLKLPNPPEIPDIMDHVFVSIIIIIGLVLIHTSIIFRNIPWWLGKFEKFEKLSKKTNLILRSVVWLFIFIVIYLIANSYHLPSITKRQ